MAALLHFLLLLSSAQGLYEYNDPAEPVMLDGSDRVRGVTNRRDQDVDFVLGGLFPVHSSADGGARCGLIRRDRGVERMEAMLYSIDIINNNTGLLPGLKLGYDIRDTCNSENLGLDEAIDLVVAGRQAQLESCTLSSSSSGSINESATFLPTSSIIGAAASAITVPVATLLRLFKVPQISYASTSTRLNNRDRYGYFYRTISPDSLQAEAMIDLCMRFNWTYVSTVYTNDFYGEPGIDQFRTRAREVGICIDIDEGINADFDDADYLRLGNSLVESATNVVVLFALDEYVQPLLASIEAINKANGTNRRFVWIASDGWARSNNLALQFNETVAGLFGFVPHSDKSEGFNDYYSQLTLSSNKRNPFFAEYYENYYNCTVNQTCNNSLPVTSHPRYKQGTIIPLIIDAVHSIAHALDDYLNDNCDKPLMWDKDTGECSGTNRTLSGPTLLQYLSNVSFISPTGRSITFDPETGNAAGGQYLIVNYQRFQNQSFGFVNVGTWNAESPSERLTLDSSLAQFGLELEEGVETLLIEPRESQCIVCRKGQYKVEIEGSCCGTCSNCTGQDYSNTSSASSCLTCPDRYWGNTPSTGSTACIALQESYLHYNDAWAIVLMMMAIIGLFSVGFVSVVLGIYWNTPIVKSSGREQMILLLIAIASTFLTTFFFVSKPTTVVCFFQRASLWFCISFVLSSLLVKLIRISRIFLRRSSVTSRPRFTEPKYQILFTLVITSVQFGLVLISMIVVYPKASEEMIESSTTGGLPSILITCDTPNIVLLIILALYHTAIIIVCNVLAVMSIRFPENFNESKYVAFSTFSLGLIWLAFTQTYIATSHEVRTAVISFALNLSCFAVLLCMFGPRIVIMIFFPERNVVQFSTQVKKNRGSVDLNTAYDTVYAPTTTNLDTSNNGLPVGSSPRVSPKPPPTVALTDIDLQKNKDNNDDSSIDDKSTRL